MNTSRNSSRSTKKKCLNNKKETHKTVSLTIFRWDQSVTKTWWRMVEAPVNFEKKSERLTLHGVTGFIPLYYLCYVYYMLNTYYKRYLFAHTLMVNHDKPADISSSCV